MVPDVFPEEWAAVLEQTTEALLERAGWTDPPIDALALAEALGIIVAFDAAQQQRGRLVRLHGPHGRDARLRQPASTWGHVAAPQSSAAICHPWSAASGSGGETNSPAAAGDEGRVLVVLRPDARPERLQWAVAHELGEYVAWQVFARLGADMRLVVPAWRERVASLLAARLLLPGRWFRPIAAAAAWDLLEIRASFRTASHELILRRMLDFDIPLVISVFDQGRLTLRRSNLPGRVPPPHADELACLRRVRHSARPARRGAVAAWPAYEPGWQRELVRWELDLGCEL